MKRKIFIVEDHEIVRESYAMFIDTTDELVVCGEAISGEEALQQIPSCHPDLVLVDLSLPGMSGIEFIKRLNASDAAPPILILTGHDNDAYRQEARQAGARDFIMKHEGPDALLQTIRAIFTEDAAASEA